MSRPEKCIKCGCPAVNTIIGYDLKCTVCTRSERDILKKDLLSIAYALGLVYEADGHAPHPAATSDLEAEIERLKSYQKHTFDAFDRCQKAEAEVARLKTMLTEQAQDHKHSLEEIARLGKELKEAQDRISNLEGCLDAWDDEVGCI